MLGELYVAFLGTSAGDGPTASRGAPCMLVHLGDEIWMVDCGDGSYRQLQQFRAIHAHRALLPGSLSAQVDFSSRTPITRIFITHLHAGHVAGLPLMLMRLLSDAVSAEVSEQLDRDRQRSTSGSASSESPPTAPRVPHITLIGPAGIRRFLRTGLGMLRANQVVARGRYTVHELLLDDDARTSCSPSHLLLPCEIPGRDISCDRSGLWREFDIALGGKIVVSSGPVLHTIPSVGYIFTEKSHVHGTTTRRRSGTFEPESSPHTRSSRSSIDSDDEHDTDGASVGGRSRRSSITHTSVISPAVASEREREHLVRGRKIVILGDTCDASSLARLALDASLVVHEATDTHLPHESSGAVRERVVARGHATAQMAGAFAKSVRARQLVLTHFCARFPAPSTPNDANSRAMNALSSQASVQWGARDHKALVFAAKDFDIVPVAHEATMPEPEPTYIPPEPPEEPSKSSSRPTHRRVRSQQYYPVAPGPPPPPPIFSGPAPHHIFQRGGPSPSTAPYPDPRLYSGQIPPPMPYAHPTGSAGPIPSSRGPSPPRAPFRDPGQRRFSFAQNPIPPPLDPRLRF